MRFQYNNSNSVRGEYSSKHFDYINISNSMLKMTIKTRIRYGRIAEERK